MSRVAWSVKDHGSRSNPLTDRSGTKETRSLAAPKKAAREGMGMATKRGDTKKMTTATKRPTTKKPAPKPKAKAAPKAAKPAPAARKPAPPPKRGPQVKLLDGESESVSSAPRKLNKAELKEMRKILEDRRQEVMRNAQKTLGEGIQLDAAELPDDMDLASSEYLQYFNLRLRGREKTYLEKIERAIGRIESGSFGQCDECGEPIGLERLRVRPEATLCIRCKEAQEREEQQFG
jgi:DnaK suppressor protein